MTTPSPGGLALAAEHLRAGRPQAARSILIEYLKTHPNSEEGWLLLSLAVTGRQQKMDCLRRALQINPHNARARDQLAKLEEQGQKAQGTSLETQDTRAEAPGAERESGPANNPRPLPKTAPFSVDVYTLPQEPARPLPAIASPPAAAAQPPAPDPVASLRERSVPAASAPPQARRLPPPAQFAAIGLTGLLLMCLFVVGILTILNLRASRQQALAPAPTVPIVSGPTNTPLLPPAWTETPTPTITPTPTTTPTRTATPTATYPPPEPSVAAQMDIIQQEVADLRGLAIQETVPRYLIPQNRVEEKLESLFYSYSSVEALRDEARVLSALGLIKPTYDLLNATLNHLSDSIGGFYLPWADELYVIGSQFNGIEKFVYSHEFNHALVDQHFAHAAEGVFPLCLTNAQQCQAVRALVEGDATLLMSQWFAQYAGPQDVNEILNYDPPALTLPEQNPPPYIIEESSFPYTYGIDFVLFLHRRGNWAEVNRAYDNLPISTEQILHPEKYVGAEPPLDVPSLALDGALGEGWRELANDSLGEWSTYLLLAYGSDLAAQVNPAQAEEAAAGWGGDNYRMYYHDATDQSVLAVRWAWDSEPHAAEFREAMLFYLDERYRGARVERSDADCWEANGQASCLFSAGAETLWLLAPDQTVLNALIELYPDF